MYSQILKKKNPQASFNWGKKDLGPPCTFWDALHILFPDANVGSIDLATTINLKCVANSYKL